MNLQDLKNKYSLLISYMESKGYTRKYIGYIEKEINWILNESGRYQWKTYNDIHQTYVENWTNIAQ